MGGRSEEGGRRGGLQPLGGVQKQISRGKCLPPRIIRDSEEAELLSGALCSLIKRAGIFGIDTHIPLDEKRVSSILDD